MPGYHVNVGSPVSLTGSHTCSSTASNLGLFATVSVVPLTSGNSYTGFTRSLAYNGAAMTSLGAVDCSASKNGWIELFYLGPTAASPTIQPSPGQHNLVFTINTAVSSILMESVSFSGVAQITPGSFVATSGAAGTSGHVTVASAPHKSIVAGFAASQPIQGQQVISTGGATAGTFPLAFNGQSATIAFNATAATVQSSLQALSTIGTGNCTVTGSTGGPWTVTWAGSLAGAAQPLISISSSGLTGGNPSVTSMNSTEQLVLQNIANTDGGNLLLADAPGAASVALTATTAASANWGMVACSVDAIAAAQSDNQAVLDGIVTGISGSTSSGNSTSTLQSTAASQQQTVTVTTSQVGGTTGLSSGTVNAALQKSSVGATGSGTNVTVGFGSYATQSTITAAAPSGTGFVASTSTYSSSGTGNPLLGASISVLNHIGITNGTGASWLAGTGASQGREFAYFPTATTTDYQVVSMTLGALNFLISSAFQENLLFGRTNSTMGTCVVAWLTSNQLTLGCFVSGTWTLFAQVAHTPISGALYQLVLGDPSTLSPYSIKVLCNGSALISYSDGTHVSQVGSSNRFGGLGMLQDTSAARAPADVSQWTIADNSPPAVVGSGTLAQQTVSASLAAHSSGAAAFPASFYDTTVFNTPDLSWNPSTNTVTISIPGWYMVNVVTFFSSYLASTSTVFFGNALMINGVWVLTGTYGQKSWGVNDCFVWYFNKNDTLTAAYYSTAAVTAPATSGSTFSVTLMNCGTLS